ncbi:MAG: hypothetical protein MMC33_004865 [Icmadophila ericetorum]|nr:hypothetical protein [Icmadophila ericetorum]
MTSNVSASIFTEKLLQVIRLQRHLATRIVIATQEPTISPKLLDLSTMTIVHRFTSPDWFRELHDHLAGVSMLGEIDYMGNIHTTRDVASIFADIVRLATGEALIFSPAALLKDERASIEIHGKDEETSLAKNMLPEKLGTDWVKIRVRKRLTEDGGRGIMAA